MSDEDFFGRPIPREAGDIEFDLCEVCQRKSPNWLEVKYEDELPVVRFTCNECHLEYETKKQEIRDDVAREINDDEVIEEAVRPGWVDDFIKEGTSTIKTIDSQPITSEEENSDAEESSIENKPLTIPSEPSEPTINFSEAPASFNDPDDTNTSEHEERIQRQIAPWTSKFIHEALFGPNPERWLDDNNGYNKENIEITITTLGSFAGHDVSSVKLSAIQCLLGAYNRNKEYKDQIISELELYLQDGDDSILEFAKSTIAQIK